MTRRMFSSRSGVRHARSLLAIVVLGCGGETVPTDGGYPPPGHLVCESHEDEDVMILVPPEQVCNAIPDCWWGQDEVDCPETPDQFVCASWWAGAVVLNDEHRCDGVIDCVVSEDGWGEGHALDERGCDDYFVCHETSFSAVSIPIERVCDGTWDCFEDELNCPLGDRFTCADGNTIPAASVCDRYDHCPDNSDENAATCPNQRACSCSVSDDSVDYIAVEQVCDGTPDCPAGPCDEEDCPEYFACNETIFVRWEDRCDGIVECPDGEDEQNCPP